MINLSLANIVLSLNKSSVPVLDVPAANDFHVIGESAAECPDTIAAVANKASQQVTITGLA
jgi:hypothetical protein